MSVAMSTRIGPGIVIKVMPGDTISISSQAWYTGSTQAPPTGLPAIADQLLTLISNGIVANGGTRRKHSREMQITGVSIMMDHVSTPFVRQSVLEEAKPTDLPDYTTFLPAGYKYGDTYDGTNPYKKITRYFITFLCRYPEKHLYLAYRPLRNLISGCRQVRPLSVRGTRRFCHWLLFQWILYTA